MAYFWDGYTSFIVLPPPTTPACAAGSRASLYWQSAASTGQLQIGMLAERFGGTNPAVWVEASAA